MMKELDASDASMLSLIAEIPNVRRISGTEFIELVGELRSGEAKEIARLIADPESPGSTELRAAAEEFRRWARNESQSLTALPALHE